MNLTVASRNIFELDPVAQLACKLFFQECFKAGIKNIFVTETYRSQQRQNHLYEQGRTRPGIVVTWTRNSRHTSRLAWDIAVGPPQGLYDIGILNKAGAIARKLGITWGGDWTLNIDRPHFEVSKTWKMPKGYEIEGKVTIPITASIKVNVEIDKEEDIMDQQFNPTSKDIKNSVAVVLNRFEQKDPTSLSKQWRRQFLKGEMTNSDAIGLLYVAVERGYIVGKKE